MEKIALIALVNLCFFFKTLGYKYSSDDIPAHARGRSAKWFTHWVNVLEGRERHTPVVDHAITMVCHTIVCILIYTAFGYTNISLLAALLFAVNPANNQGSVWIAGRGYVLSTLGILGVMTIPLAGPVFLALATYYNAGFLMPLVLAGSEYAPMLLIVPFIWAIQYKRFKRNVMDKAKMEMFKEDKAIKPQKLVLAIKTFGFYLVHALVPIKTTFYHSFLQSLAGSGAKRGYSMRCRFFWIGLAAISGIAWYWICFPWNMVSFGLLWWCLGIAPFLNLFRMNQEIAERYIYLPNVGLMFVLAAFIQGYPVATAVFLTMYATKMWFYMDAYQDDYYLIENSCMNSPDAWFAWHVRAMKRWDTQSYKEACILWCMAKLISPNEFKILYNLSTVLALGNNKKEALEYLALAEQNIPPGQEDQARKLIDEFRKGQCAVLL
jgi:MFS family permease